MKIAFTFLTYGKNVFGGIENALFNLTKGLKDIGHEPIVFTSSTYSNSHKDNLPAKIFVSKHLPSHYDGIVSNLINQLRDRSAKINKDFDLFLATYTPDYIVVVDPIWGIIQSTNYPINQLSSKTPVAISYHIANTWRETKDIMKSSFDLNYNVRFAVSDFLVKEIKKTYINSKGCKILTLPNSIDTNLYSTAAPITHEKYIFCNSRIAKGKNVDLLVKAFHNVVSTNPIKLKLCAGDFPFGETSHEIEEIRMLIRKLSLETKVELLDAMKWNEIPSIIANSALVVLPSTHETFGIAALEASAAGIPLIVSNTNNFKHLVKENAIFFKPNSIIDLQTKMKEVLRNYGKYKENAIKYSQTFKERYDNRVVARKLVDEVLHHNLL